ncbi:hypothetical protein [Pseudolactococcus insecticola]|uniref:Uncharacterized protein n=1 Tax=Pseudolactococcus insecticola TaxID=2709158 RepID=A0A6A0B5H3_9LACT|nr:hypothetical protein [Lactococcus insecticola]GFH40659.1 hypothetical protein Hs20B_10570 [Lactococcus insecticola]
MKEQLQDLVNQGQDFTLDGADFIKVGISYKKGELRAYQIIPFTALSGITAVI